jgi:hypothetical protein
MKTDENSVIAVATKRTEFHPYPPKSLVQMASEYGAKRFLEN